MFGFAPSITINTLWYSLLWLGMMIIGGACYEQRYIVKKRGKKLQTLAIAGWTIIITGMLGFIHGILAIFHLILAI